jgi:hypothetical protein
LLTAGPEAKIDPMLSPQPSTFVLEPLERRCLFSTAPSSGELVEPIRQARRTRAQSPTATFAVIGDYGFHTGEGIGSVSRMVRSWNPQFIITTGDNNYPSGAASTIDQNVGQHFHEFIAPYKGRYGAGAARNRFFPSLGNHDWAAASYVRTLGPRPWTTAGPEPYLDYFTLPGNERYYEFVRGPVHFFALDSDQQEPDGTSRDSKQAKWLKERLAASTSPFKLVYFHHPPYSSGEHGSSKWMRWPFRRWGADVVLSGHDHDYERIMRDGFPYFVNGAGGGRRGFDERVGGSVVRFEGFGAMLVRATRASVWFQFYTSPSGKLIDDFTLAARPEAAPAQLAAAAAPPKAAPPFSITPVRRRAFEFADG